MARELKKPNVIMENELKEYAGPIVIEVSEKKEEVKIEKKEELLAIPTQAISTPVITISFNAWFQKKCSKNPKLKLSYRESIEAHFKAIGLGNNATAEEYDAALVHFGL